MKQRIRCRYKYCAGHRASEEDRFEIIEEKACPSCTSKFSSDCAWCKGTRVISFRDCAVDFLTCKGAGYVPCKICGSTRCYYYEEGDTLACLDCWIHSPGTGIGKHATYRLDEAIDILYSQHEDE
jgi:hypothetical protein